MQIGNQYADNRIYRGIRHYDAFPLTAEDMHEYEDTQCKKTAYIMNNILGYGILNTPSLRVSDRGIHLEEPAIALIDGDIALIQSDAAAPIISRDNIYSTGYTSGSVCVIGWYQHINENSSMREYGGINNSIITNNLKDNAFKVQVSSRYQFRWVPVLIDSDSLSSDQFNISIPGRNDYGAYLSGVTFNISATRASGDVFKAEAPARMDYAESELYIVPLLKYQYSSNPLNITVENYLPVRPKGTPGIIRSEETPLGDYIEGTLWYNPITREFKTYVIGEGFVDSASKMAFLQYQSVYTIKKDSNSTDVVVPININEFSEGDILQVSYEGLVLTKDVQYTVNYNDHTISLLNFTVYTGESVTFTVTKIVEANDITSITALFTTHMSVTSSNTREGHVKLSDAIDGTLDASKGIAATPKAVEDAKFIKDDTTGTKYKFGVANGLIYLEEG